MVTKQLVHQGERVISRKAIAQGRLGVLRCPVCSCAPFLVQTAHETAGAARTRSSLRPLVFGGQGIFRQSSGASRGETAKPYPRRPGVQGPDDKCRGPRSAMTKADGNLFPPTSFAISTGTNRWVARDNRRVLPPSAQQRKAAFPGRILIEPSLILAASGNRSGRLEKQSIDISNAGDLGMNFHRTGFQMRPPAHQPIGFVSVVRQVIQDRRHRGTEFS